MTDAARPRAPEPTQDQQPPQAISYYWTFGGPITESSVERWVKAVPLMMRDPTGVHHIAIQSMGGTIGDGIWLYNFLKGFPRGLIVYNTGTLASIAAVAYLGAPQRRVSTHATFMIHRSTYQPQPATTTNLAHATKILAIEDARTEAILRERARLTDAHWRQLEHHDLWLTAQEAVEVGLADAIGEFTPPMGGLLLMI